jgi:hypothetical protein
MTHLHVCIAELVHTISPHLVHSLLLAACAALAAPLRSSAACASARAVASCERSSSCAADAASSWPAIVASRASRLSTYTHIHIVLLKWLTTGDVFAILRNQQSGSRRWRSQ